jgi:hypothetical protein
MARKGHLVGIWRNHAPYDGDDLEWSLTLKGQGSLDFKVDGTIEVDPSGEIDWDDEDDWERVWPPNS